MRRIGLISQQQENIRALGDEVRALVLGLRVDGSDGNNWPEYFLFGFEDYGATRADFICLNTPRFKYISKV
jgi:hypothetical protein